MRDLRSIGGDYIHTLQIPTDYGATEASSVEVCRPMAYAAD